MSSLFIGILCGFTGVFLVGNDPATLGIMTRGRAAQRPRHPLTRASVSGPLHTDASRDQSDCGMLANDSARSKVPKCSSARSLLNAVVMNTSLASVILAL